MRKHLIISYEFTGKDFRNYVSSFAFSSDATNNDELANEILEAANDMQKLSTRKNILLVMLQFELSSLLK